MLSSLTITNFRNITSTKLSAHPQFNFLIGGNGSGKTSFLEAIYYLFLGKSFRSSTSEPLIKHQSDEFTVFAQLESGDLVGLQRHREGNFQLKLNGKESKKISEAARLLPVQLMNHLMFSIIDGPPKGRRQFLDWGVFHVEHRYLEASQRFKKSLTYRNKALKERLSESEIKAWDHEFIANGEQIDEFRKQYIEELAEYASETVGNILNCKLTMDYERGWRAEQSLSQSLSRLFSQEKHLGSTLAGPHRADIKISLNDKPAEQVASRGQQKVITAALRIAQGKLLSTKSQRKSVYLFDDFAAELDQHNRNLLMDILQQMNAQVFLAVNDQNQIQTLYDRVKGNMFHVEQGTFNEVA